MLTGGPNYIMIRRAIFGKVHGHGVKEIWLISQFPAKHTGVASGAKIVFARPGLARLLGCGQDGVINNEFNIYIACSPQSDCILLFRDPSVTFRPSRIIIYVRDVILVVTLVYKQSRQNISGFREKKRRSLKYQNKMSFQISLCHFALGVGGGDSLQFQFARKSKVTTKYWANCRIHARMRNNIKNNFLFKVGWKV